MTQPLPVVDEHDAQVNVAAWLRQSLSESGWDDQGVVVAGDRGDATTAVVVQRSGGNLDAVTDQWRVLLSCYGPTAHVASALGYAVSAAVWSWHGKHPVKTIQISGPVEPFPRRAAEPHMRTVTATLVVRRLSTEHD